jgi:hypothetical protein
VIDTATALEELRHSSKFRDWRPAPEASGLDTLEESKIMAEKHYTPDDLAALWGVSAETVRNIFRKEQGVLRITQPKEKKRRYVLTRIPHSVAERVHKRLSAVPQ